MEVVELIAFFSVIFCILDDFYEEMRACGSYTLLIALVNGSSYSVFFLFVFG